MDENQYVRAFLLSTAAGLATCIGGAIVFSARLIKMADDTFMAIGLGLAAGVMVFVTFVDIYSKSLAGFAHDGADNHLGTLYATICFFCGVALMKIIDMGVHRFLDYHGGHCHVETTETCDDSECGMRRKGRGSLLDQGCDSVQVCAEMQKEISPVKDPEKEQILVRMGFATCIAIFIHNFPEGIATFTVALAGEGSGVALAFAIGMHNIPEGICVAIPIFYGTGSAWKAFGYATLSGLSEPIGAAIAWILIASLEHFDVKSLDAEKGEGKNVYGIIFGVVAGMMTFIVFAELLPVAYRYDVKDKVTSNVVFVGMFILAISIWAIEGAQA